MTLRYAARQQTAQMPLWATWPTRTEGGQIALIWARAMARRQPVASVHNEGGYVRASTMDSNHTK